jgi:hypothetical protein
MTFKIKKELIEEIENKLAKCSTTTLSIKNGNSLRMELELHLFKKIGEESFYKNYPKINTEITTILNNINVR